MYRKGVSALILNKNNEVLLVNLLSFKEKYFAVPGGGIERGESLQDAIHREIREELGIEKESLDFVGKSNIPLKVEFKEIQITQEDRVYTGSERYFFGFRFIGDNSEIVLKHDEVRDYKWVPIELLRNYLLFDNQLEETKEKLKEIFSL